ncbi:MAG: DegT/DnrJ/EryC1/StrS family aminotransferase [Actinomycetota bacterium]|nr:DegT/DnrJ/EryC1/StrS family aminotransferase [Actinomycetota bacterium]
MRRIALAQPHLAGNERAYVLDCIDSNWISSIGKYVTEFEQRFASFCGVPHAIATNNGTTALHLALVALGLQAGDEVLVPDLTYIATANAVQYCGATPVFVDIDEHTLNIDPALVEAQITPRTKGIIAVHLYGHPADMMALQLIARRHGLWLVEDAAEAHGAEIGGRRVGSLGDCATFSFFGNKIITTGEGGMVTTTDAALAARLRLLRGQGMDPDRRYWFPVVGFNYRITNIQAALGVAQMETVDASLDARDRLAAWYLEDLAPLEGLVLTKGTQPCMRRVHWMFNVFLADGGEERRARVMEALDQRGIETRPMFYPMHLMPPYATPDRFPVTTSWAARGITLPTHQGVTRDDVHYICQQLQAVLGGS